MAISGGIWAAFNGRTCRDRHWTRIALTTVSRVIDRLKGLGRVDNDVGDSQI